MKIARPGICYALFFLCCLSASLIFTAAYARSPGEPSLPAYVMEGPVPGGYITGHVVDEDGKPVPGATVSLLQGGQLWQPDKYGYPRLSHGINPQTTRITYHDTEGFLDEGSFLFGLPIPEEYTLTAEKYGYNGSANVHVAHELLYRDTDEPVSRVITVNITLSGYRQPTYSPEQLSYTGAIVGEIRTAHGYRSSGVGVSLWQDGRMVKTLNNPQSSMDMNYSGKTIDYMFEHLAPGRYTVMTTDYDNRSEMVTVDVGTRIMRADIVLSYALHQPYGWPDVSFTPTVGEFSASNKMPTPAPSVLFVVLTIGIVALLELKKNEKRGR